MAVAVGGGPREIEACDHARLRTRRSPGEKTLTWAYIVGPTGFEPATP